jgi:hypothetical protein
MLRQIMMNKDREIEELKSSLKLATIQVDQLGAFVVKTK